MMIASVQNTLNSILKRIIYLILLIGYFSFSQDYVVPNEQLKGNIKSINIFKLENNKEIPVELKNFDTKGRVLLLKTYYDGRLHTTERNQYNNNQIITEFCDYCDDIEKEFLNFSIKENQKNPYSGYATADPRRTFKHIKTLDKSGKVTTLKTYSSEGYLIWNTKFIYDKKSSLILEEKFDDENKKLSFKKNIFNDKGLIIEETEFKNDYEKTTNYTYDNFNRKIVEKTSQGKRVNEIFIDYIIEKDSTKVLSFVKQSDNNEKILKKMNISYPFKENNMTKEIYFIKNKPNSTIISEYNKNQKLLSEKIYNSKNELISEKTFSYDKKGNWFELISSNLINKSYNGSEPKPEWEIKNYIRKIEYYQ